MKGAVNILHEIIESVRIFEDITIVSLFNTTNENLNREIIFSKLAEENINLDMISQTPFFGGDITLSFSLADKDFSKALHVISDFKNLHEKLEVKISSQNMIISFISAQMINTSGIASAVFGMFGQHGVNITLVTTSDISISCLIAKSDSVKAIKMLTDNKLI